MRQESKHEHDFVRNVFDEKEGILQLCWCGEKFKSESDWPENVKSKSDFYKKLFEKK